MFIALASLFSNWPKYNEAINTGIWTPSEKPQKREAQVRRKHVWIWSKERNLFRCEKCHSTAFCTTKLLECIPVPEPPQGKSPYMPDRLHPSHVVWDITKEDKDPIWYCSRCGQYAYRRFKNMLEPCRGPLEKKSSPWYRLQKLKEGRYPNTGQIWAKPTLSLRSFKGHADELSTKVLKVRSEPPPVACVSAPSTLHVSMEDMGMWSDFADHMTHGAVEVEELDPAFELDFYGSELFSL